MRRVKTATCTSGEPVSVSCRAVLAISLAFLRFVSIGAIVSCLLHLSKGSRAVLTLSLWRGRSCRSSGTRLHVQQFDVKNEGRIRGDNDLTGRVFLLLGSIPKFWRDRKRTRLNSSHMTISYPV